MSTPKVISVEDVSVGYPMYGAPVDVLKEMVFGGVRHDIFWALRDINFHVELGERVGIIGPNGAGKTTLLRLITGNLQPSKGKISVEGRISAMLSLASHMNPEETGMENIRLNLLIYGCDPKKIPELTEEIVDFTELGAFIYAPVRTYSSGMNARLAFAISTAITPDILVVDEVLSVGDAYFVGKAITRMKELCKKGRALLYVSHALSSVQMLCDSILWIENGGVRARGPVDQVVKLYEEDWRAREDEATRRGNAAKRQQMVNQVTPGELTGEGVVRLRLVSRGRAKLRDTYYVNRITLTANEKTIETPLDLVDVLATDWPAALDVVNSEWGRLHLRRERDCRTMVAQPGKRPGGHLLVRRASPGDLPLTVEIVYTGIGEQADLQVEYLDVGKAEWKPLEAGQAAIADGWVQQRFQGVVPSTTAAAQQEVLARLVEEVRLDAEVLQTQVLVDGQPETIVNEGQRFEVRVKARSHLKLEEIDVGIKFTRADGVYTFWESSGRVGGDLKDIQGDFTVTFVFDPNVFGSGQYSITTYLANGWNLQTNYPYSEVFDRKVDNCKFTIQRKYRALDFGVVTLQVPVRIERDVQGAHESSSAAGAGAGDRSHHAG